jgi:hypothetical protein
MEPHPKLRTLVVLTWLIALLLAGVSICGLLIPATYALEAPAFAVQGLGQDGMDLFIILPALLLALMGLKRKWRAAWHIWAGLILYLIYTFVIYAFSLYFNYLFLAYCALLGLSVFAALIYFTGLRPDALQQTYGPQARVKLLAIYLFFVAVIFALVWLREDIPALLSGSLPASVKDQGLRTNAVHILDLSLLLPGMVITAIALLRRKAFAFIFGPVLAAFSVVMALSIAALVMVMKLKGQTGDWIPIVIFYALALISLGVFVAFEQSPKAPSLS